MATIIEPITPQKILELAQTLPPADLLWLQEQLNQLLQADEPLPEQATLDEAIDLFLADKCSLGRAAELTGVTRWDIQDILKERGIPIMISSSKTVEEMDAQLEDLERRGIL